GRIGGGQIVQRDAHMRVILAERLLLNGQRSPLQRLRLRGTRREAVDLRKNGRGPCNLRVGGTERFFLQLKRTLHLRLGFGEASGAHTNIREKIERLRYPGVLTAWSVLANRECSPVIFLGLGVAAFAEVGISEVFQGIADNDLVAAGIILDSRQSAFLYGFGFAIAALMLIDAAEAVQRFCQVPDRSGACRAF